MFSGLLIFVYKFANSTNQVLLRKFRHLLYQTLLFKSKLANKLPVGVTKKSQMLLIYKFEILLGIGAVVFIASIQSC